MHGHLAAHLDPLGTAPPGDPALDPDRLIPQLTPELQSRIPARLLRLYCEGDSLREVLPKLRATYCGTMAYEIEHISNHEQRVWLRNAIESGRYRRELGADEKKSLLTASVRDRRARDVPPPGVPRPEVVLARGPRRDDPDARRGARAVRGERCEGRRARHGAPRPAERDRPHARASLRGDPQGVRGRADARGRHARPRGRHRRRQVPLRLPGRSPDQARRGEGAARVQPEPPRGRRSGRRGHGARAADRPRRGRARPRPDRRDGAPHPRGRGLRRPGDRGRDAEPDGPQRLLDRRHAPRRREQPDRLHDEPGGGALDPLLERHRQGLRRADHPRERRRSRGRARRDPPRDGLPRGVPARRDRGSRRLPALRPQRGRRARVHAAAHVRADRRAPDRPRAVREGSDRARRRHAGRGRGDARRGRQPDQGRPRRAADGDLRGCDGPAPGAQARPRRRRGARDRDLTRPAREPERAAARRAARLHRPSQAVLAARAPPRRARARRRHRLGARRGLRAREA